MAGRRHSRLCGNSASRAAVAASGRARCVETYGIVEDRHLPRVVCDDQAIGRLAAEHLLDRSLKRFAYCGFAGVAWSDNRCLGFAATRLRRRVFPASVTTMYAMTSPAPGKKLRRASPTGSAPSPSPSVSWPAPMLAQQVLDACRRASVAVPEEVAVVGVDNDEDLCRLCDPPLSSVINNPRQVGYEAAQLLAQLMAKGVRPDEIEPHLIQPLGVVTHGSPTSRPSRIGRWRRPFRCSADMPAAHSGRRCRPGDLLLPSDALPTL